jgi:hypothetical protein
MPVDVNRLYKEGLYESREPVGGLVADLDRIQSMASGWRKARRGLALWTTISWAVAVIAFVIFWPIGIVLGVLGGWLLYRMNRYPAAVANHLERCTFGKSMAVMLASDADPAAPVAMRLVFDDKAEALPIQNRKTGHESLSKMSWFSLEASLHDGTSFSETIDDIVYRRSYSNARGKSKTKTRRQNLIGMKFDYPQKTYGDLTPLREKMEKEIQLPAGTIVKALEISPKAIKVKAMVTQFGKGTDLAQASSMLALGVYRMLNLSREIEARKRTQAKRGGPQ